MNILKLARILKKNITAMEHDGYVGLRWFVATVLYEKEGFAIGPSYTVVISWPMRTK